MTVQYRFKERAPNFLRQFTWIQKITPNWQSVILAVSIAIAACLNYSFVIASDTRGNDDAAIAWRYALNLAHGHGLVYNRDEYVEGYSSLGYVLALGCTYRVDQAISPLLDRDAALGDMYWISLIYNFAAWIAAMLLLYRFAREEVGHAIAPFVALITGASPAIAYWAISGLETVPAMLSQMLVWIWTVRVATRSGSDHERRALVALALSMALCLVMRAEGFLWPFLSLAYLLLFQRLYKQSLKLGAVFFVVMGALIAWRMWYYGYPLPNTYYAKVTGALTSRLASAWSMRDHILYDTGMAFPLLAIGVTALRSTLRLVKGKRLQSITFEVIASAAWLVWWFYVGGDIYFERFLIILIPLGIVAASRLSKSVPVNNAMGLLFLCVILYTVLLPFRTYWGAVNFYHGDSWATLGRRLGREFPNATLATGAAGKLPYFSGLKTIDVYGLADEHIAHKGTAGNTFVLAHNKTDFDYVMGKDPDILAAWIYAYTDKLTFDDAVGGKSLIDLRSMGYQLIYLVDPCRYHLLKVKDQNEEELMEAVRRGLCFAVLRKSPEGPPREQSNGAV